MSLTLECKCCRKCLIVETSRHMREEEEVDISNARHNQRNKMAFVRGNHVRTNTHCKHTQELCKRYWMPTVCRWNCTLTHKIQCSCVRFIFPRPTETCQILTNDKATNLAKVVLCCVLQWFFVWTLLPRLLGSGMLCIPFDMNFFLKHHEFSRRLRFRGDLSNICFREDFRFFSIFSLNFKRP